MTADSYSVRGPVSSGEIRSVLPDPKEGQGQQPASTKKPPVKKRPAADGQTDAEEDAPLTVPKDPAEQHVLDHLA